MVYMHHEDWLFAMGVIFFLISVWGIGANDIANSFATSVSSRSLTMVQAGILATICEFVGAMALGQEVTGVLILANVVAEFGSATWLTLCTRLGFPVSTTQSIVGALISVAIAADLPVSWGWKKSSVSQIAASWGIAPCIAAGFGAIIMLSIKLLVHQQKDPLKAGLRVITFYYALAAGVLALFIVISGNHGIPTLDELGAGKAIAIVLGVFFGAWLIAATFFLPYFYRKLVKEDRRLRFWHIPMGPLLWRDGYSLYLPGDEDKGIIPDYYASDYRSKDLVDGDNESDEHSLKHGDRTTAQPANSDEKHLSMEGPALAGTKQFDAATDKARHNDLAAVEKLPWAHPRRIWAMVRLVATFGLTRDIVGHQSRGLESVHQRAPVFDNKVEHLWTTAQVLTAMLMFLIPADVQPHSIAHGANDISNAIGPFTTEYETWSTGVVSAKTDTPYWIKAVGGLGLGVGFWIFGYHIMRNLGNRITKHSPTRGYSMELAAAITVLLASNLGLPVSTTQCITGAIIGVALTNADLKSINWKQVGKIFIGWCLTLPCAGLVAGLIMGMALNVPRWNQPVRG